ncbi:type I glyceraldehyde-3-phosphate dehydrogenase [Chloroflexota bacterium]
MTTRVGINGFGRIGRLTVRTINKYHRDTLSVAMINGPADTKTNAHLLKYDSAYGKYPGTVEAGEDSIIIDGAPAKFSSERDPTKLPWGDNGVDIVIDSTGTLRDASLLKAHIDNGAKKVILSAPGKNDDITIVIGVNEKQYEPDKHHIISCASCTTNCIAPVAKVLHNDFGITKGLMTTVHAYTRDQNILDRRHDDLRRARSAAVNIVPTTTGAAKLVGQLIPELEGRITGISIRVPVPVVSLVDLVADLDKNVTVDEINKSFSKAAEGELRGILEYSEDPLVSSDCLGTSSSAIFDSLSTMVIKDNMVKVLAWYDNEWGYSCRLSDLASLVAEKGL